jgi:hypothetical protein
VPGQVHVTSDDGNGVRPPPTGLAEGLAVVLDRQHVTAVVVDVAAALGVLSALLGDREVEPGRRPVPLRPVLLGGRQARGVRALDEAGGVQLVVLPRQQVVAPAERIEVVELDGVESVLSRSGRSSAR